MEAHMKFVIFTIPEPTIVFRYGSRSSRRFFKDDNFHTVCLYQVRFVIAERLIHDIYF